MHSQGLTAPRLWEGGRALLGVDRNSKRKGRCRRGGRQCRSSQELGCSRDKRSGWPGQSTSGMRERLGLNGSQPPLGSSQPSRFEQFPYFKPSVLPEASDFQWFQEQRCLWNFSLRL